MSIQITVHCKTVSQTLNIQTWFNKANYMNPNSPVLELYLVTHTKFVSCYSTRVQNDHFIQVLHSQN